MDLYNLIISAKLSKGEGGGGDVSVEELNVTDNGTYTAPAGKAYSPVKVNVPKGITPSGTKSITANGNYDVTSFASASVNVPSSAPTTQALTVTENGTYNVPSGVDGFNPVTVNVSGGGGSDLLEKVISRSRELTEITVNCDIGAYALANCQNLKKITTTEGCKMIDGKAIYNCSALTTFDFGTGITNIQSNAFNGAGKLETIIVRATTPPAMYGANNINSTAKIYVPDASLDAYKTASNWKNIASQIYPLSEYQG